VVKTRIESVLHRLIAFFRENPLGFPLLLLGLALVTYGVFITSLGFYWDDWPPLVFSHIADKSALLEYFSFDRPFQSWTYYLLLPICRDSAFAWQLSVILFRWTSAFALYSAFALVLPRYKHILQWAAVLFIVFPGFSDQYASVAFGSHFLTYTVFGLSLLTMVLALKDRKRFWLFYPLSLLLTAIHLFTMEYFVGLEALRPVLIYLVLVAQSEKKTKPLLKSLLVWLPYVAVFGFYIYWRLILYPSTAGGGQGENYPYIFQNLLNSPLDALIALAGSIYADLRFMLLSAWTDKLLPLNVSQGPITLWSSLAIGLSVTWIIYHLLPRREAANSHPLTTKEVLAGVLLGFFIILAGLAPLWSTLRQVTIGKWSNRFDIPAIWGIGLFIAAGLFALLRQTRLRRIFFVILVGLAVSYQIRTGSDYRKDFIRQEDFYTQLSWRIPALEPGTALYSPGVPTAKEADYSYSFGINLLYTGDQMDSSVDYWFTGPRYYAVEDIAALTTVQIDGGLRIFHFTTPASNVVSIYLPQTGCLWVVDPYYALIPAGVPDFATYGKITRDDLILDEDTGINGLSNIFDFNAKDSWCYYFEKGDLAQSKGQWQKTVSYYEQAMAANLVPLEGIEYLPFVKAYARMGSIDKAISLTKSAMAKSYFTKPSLCQFWHDILEELPTLNFSGASEVYNRNYCPSFFTSDQA